MILFQESSSCVATSPANQLHMGMEGTSKDIRVRPTLSSKIPNCSTQFPENFDALADLIAAYPLISRSTHFLFVPGPLDITMNTTLPRRALLSSLVGRLKTKVPKAHFGTNPCRIKFFDQEIVVFREDLMARMLRNVVGVKQDVKSEDLKRFVSFYKHLVVVLLSQFVFSWCNRFLIKVI